MLLSQDGFENSATVTAFHGERENPISRAMRYEACITVGVVSVS